MASAGCRPAKRAAGHIGALLLFVALVLLTGCGPKKPQAKVPPPPPPIQTQPTPSRGSQSAKRVPQTPQTEAGEGSQSAGQPDVPADAPVLYTETGLASWYGPPYHNRRAANGDIYDMHAFTAAHRTLPMNSLVRVTNVATGHSAVVRITDRGPFIEGRILDLSLAAAQAVDVWRPGVARVRVDVLETPLPIAQGGRWCVQIGAFTDVDEATRLKESLARRYQSARVLQFAGPTGEWLRIRVAEDDRRRAESLARETQTTEGAVFVVRLD